MKGVRRIWKIIIISSLCHFLFALKGLKGETGSKGAVGPFGARGAVGQKVCDGKCTTINLSPSDTDDGFQFLVIGGQVADVPLVFLPFHIHHNHECLHLLLARLFMAAPTTKMSFDFLEMFK